jgi:ATP-dependent RNA helicase RhlE
MSLLPLGACVAYRKTNLNQNNFKSLGIDGKFLRILNEQGYQQPTPIQTQAIPSLLKGKDLVGVAQTGTGKTAAFALPLLQRLDKQNSPAKPRKPRALILAPTRELALQIHEEIRTFSRGTGLRHSFIFGGVGQNPQVKALAKGLDVLVATPGRLLDLAGQRHLDLSDVSVLVLDEADRLLDMGFVRDVKRIVAQTPDSRQSLLFSATMPKEVAMLAREILNHPVKVDVSPKQMTVKEIDQRVVMVGNGDKRRMLECLLRDDEVSRAIVFTRTKHGADKVTRQLIATGFGAEAIHGNKSQNARQRALQNFKNGDIWVLVATDIAARGIDIEAVSHVFNYELPHEPESYVHRIGRTGRAGATGVAWSLVDPSERPRLRAVERLIRHSPAEVDVQLPERDSTEPEKSAPRREKRKSVPSQAKAGSNASAGGRKSHREAPGRSRGDQKSDGQRRVRRKSRQRAA